MHIGPILIDDYICHYFLGSFKKNYFNVKIFLNTKAQNKYEHVKRESLKKLYAKKVNRAQMDSILEQIKTDNETELKTD